MLARLVSSCNEFLKLTDRAIERTASLCTVRAHNLVVFYYCQFTKTLTAMMWSCGLYTASPRPSFMYADAHASRNRRMRTACRTHSARNGFRAHSKKPDNCYMLAFTLTVFTGGSQAPQESIKLIRALHYR